MSNSPEHDGSHLEVLSVNQADAYIQAVNWVFSEGTVIVPGVTAHTVRTLRRNGAMPAFMHGELDVRKFDTIDDHYDLEPDEIIWFETEANQGSVIADTRIARFHHVAGENGMLLTRSKQLIRTHVAGMDQPEYRLEQLLPDRSRRGYTARTPEERQAYEALFVSMTSEFRDIMHEKLIGKPDLIDRIDAHLRDAPEDPASNLGNVGVIGRFMLRKL